MISSHIRRDPKPNEEKDIGGRIEEMGYLSQLRGKLSIYNLEHVRDKEEARSAKLSEKKGVHKLGFHWNSGREGTINDEDVLEGLQPHPCLQSLKIENFQGEKFPSWILGKNSSGGLFLWDHLLEIFLKNCNKCEQIPTLGHLSHLKVLEIEGMNNVTCIGTEFYGNYSGEGSSNAVFPALEKLVLKRMPKLVEWKDAMEPTTTTRGTVFPSLKKLVIENCAQLISAPCHFPALEKLRINKTKSTAFQNISSNLTTLMSLTIECVSELSCLPEQLLQNNASLMRLVIHYCADLESILPHEDVGAFCISLRYIYISSCLKLSYIPDTLHTLQSLETFGVDGCSNLRHFPSIQGVASLRDLIISCGVEVLPTGLQSCTSLSELRISSCPNLISIPDLGELHSLSRLTILGCPKLTRLPGGLSECLKTLEIGGFCEELDAFPSLSSIQHLHASLEELDLYGWSKLNSLPDEIQYFTALIYLYIWDFDGMKALPEWLGNLSSLQTLVLNHNKNLMEMPTVQAMRRLTKLKQLYINGCPELKERCAKEKGTEWSKIAHIPYIRIDGHKRSWRNNQLKLMEVHNYWKRRFYSRAENCNYDYKKLMHLHKHNVSPYCGKCKVFIDLRKDVPRKMTRLSWLFLLWHYEWHIYCVHMKEDLINLMEFQSTPKLTEIHQCWVNFDAAVFEEIQKIGVGVVVLDEHRLFIGPLSSLEDMSTDAEEAEVMAVMQATEFAMPFWSNYRREISFSHVSKTGCLSDLTNAVVNS
ncbi:hypothetical protein CMV_015996 [Castanea mollissima]|uniref:R13L1/DRL21-like LRR repeat region domain-containing protein n=1 Tax=Castanea mollissima TaxID=60419 RepID=A0A8J4VS41_9ROSI|nr:hypothetical protein CMV_015996 [Castanea mollissima]